MTSPLIFLLYNNANQDCVSFFIPNKILINIFQFPLVLSQRLAELYLLWTFPRGLSFLPVSPLKLFSCVAVFFICFASPCRISTFNQCLLHIQITEFTTLYVK